MTGKVKRIIVGIFLIVVGVVFFPLVFAFVYTGTPDYLFLVPIFTITIGVNTLIRGLKFKTKVDTQT